MMVALGSTKLFSNCKEPSSLLTQAEFVLHIGVVNYCHPLDCFKLADRLVGAQRFTGIK